MPPTTPPPVEPAPRFSIDLMGDVAVIARSSGQTLVIPRGSRELLGALAIFASQRPIRREALADLLWPESDEAGGRARLRTGLWRLKKALEAQGDGAAIIGQNVDMVWLNRSQTDLPCHLVFAAGIDRLCGLPLDAMGLPEFQEMDHLLALYSAPLMVGHDCQWVLQERARLADLYGRGLERQIAWYRRSKDGENAANLARRLLCHDPYREDIHALLIGIYGQVGQPQKAIRQFDLARSAMEQDLGVKPNQARAALDRVLAGDPDDLARGIAGLDASIRRLDRQIAQFCAAFAATTSDSKRSAAKAETAASA